MNINISSIVNNPVVSSIIYLMISCIMLYLSKYMFDKFALLTKNTIIKINVKIKLRMIGK